MVKIKKIIKRGFDINEVSYLQAGLVSPQKVLDWSNGEVKKSETINYRTQRAENNGLFDEKIFGSERNYECACGKYRDKRYKGIVCDKCEVEVAHSSVRRTRMGHITLQIPVAHIWYLKTLPSKMSLLLGLNASEVQKVVYFASYIITEVDKKKVEEMIIQLKEEYKEKQKDIKNAAEKTKLKDIYQIRLKELQSLNPRLIMSEDKYNRFILRYSSIFKAEIGGEAIYNMLKDLDLKKLEKDLISRIGTTTQVEKQKVTKQLSLVRAFIRSKQRPEWMFFINLPIIPAALRPMMALEGGKYAVSDLNDLYRRVINRNNRLKRLININAPEVILRNEKRILQEAVDALIDGTIRTSQKAGSYSRNQLKKLKSLTEYIGSKKGYFRANLLGKRVDYSARTVIVVGSDLKLDECGLPKAMALELFRQFVISKLLEKEIVFNIRSASRLIDEKPPEVWKILEDVIKGKYVLLNRPPTLHRQSIQAFKPKLLESKAIQLHPLVCSAYNADFDGDAMTVHLPLTEEAQYEAKNMMCSIHNIISPGDRNIIASPNRQDMVLGCYWMTKVISGAKGEGKYFSDTNEAINSYELGMTDLRAMIKVLSSDKEKYSDLGSIFETTVGRLLFNTILPKDYKFVNKQLTNKIISHIVINIMDNYPIDSVVKVLDNIKNFGFYYATRSGITWSLSDTKIPSMRKELIEKGFAENDVVTENYNKGLLSNSEKKRMVIKVWQNVRSEIMKEVMGTLEENSSVKDIIESGSRGSPRDLTNITGMRGIISSAKGDSIEHPITRCYKKGLNPIEYFVDGYGARKGLSDQALKTSESGYFGRRLFEVGHDVIVREHDCKTTSGFRMNRLSSTGNFENFANRIQGRFILKDIKDSKGKIIANKGEYIDRLRSIEIADSGTEYVDLRSTLECKISRGVCQLCYGDDTSKNDNSLIDFGEAVGVIAAQSIGEPATQLTMDTVHHAGTLNTEGDITQGLPRVIELFDKRTPKDAAAISRIDGVVSKIEEVDKSITVTISPKNKDTKVSKKNSEYIIPITRIGLVKEGDIVEEGQFLTDGSADLNELFKYAGKERTLRYLYDEVTKVYERQDRNLVPKHYELIIRQMFNRLKIIDSGDSLFSMGDIIEEAIYERTNKELKTEGKNKIKAEPIILGITEVSITRYGFLSAVSFQNTRKVLINAAIEGAKDSLEGLKENVILGHLIPAGTGYKGSKKNMEILNLQKELEGDEEEVVVNEDLI